MDFFSFLHHVRDITWLEQQRFICLKSTAYQPLFCAYLIAQCAQRLGRELLAFDAETLSLQELHAQLTINFLGQRSVLWIKNIPELETAQQKALAHLLEREQYTHLVICAAELTTPLKSQDGGMVITVPATISADQAPLILQALTIDASPFIKKIFGHQKELEIDQLFLLSRYAGVLGRSSELFFTHWLDRILEPEQSLFTLSQYFFAGNVAQFSSLWSETRSQYPDEFWTVYWSEQLWQAMIFCTEAPRRGIPEAKKLVSRLPFSFMQKDWQQYHIAELVHAHDELYRVEHALKNSVGTFGLDLFIEKFLHRVFRVK